MTNKKKKNGNARGKKVAAVKQQQQQQQQQPAKQTPPPPPQPEATPPQTQPASFTPPPSPTTAEDDDDDDNHECNHDHHYQQQKKAALDWKDHGNVMYGTADYETAAKAYQSGLDCLVVVVLQQQQQQQQQPGESSDTMETEADTSTPATTITTATAGPSSPPLHQQQREENPLALALRSNLAMCYIKLEQFYKAEQECTRILQVEPENAKALYRRALAREGAAINSTTRVGGDYDNNNNSSNSSSSTSERSNNNHHHKEHQLSLIASAMKDLDVCLNLLRNADPSSLEQKRMMKDAETALGRIEKSYTNRNPLVATPSSPKKQRSNGNTPTTSISATTTTTSTDMSDSLSSIPPTPTPSSLPQQHPSPPSKSQQKHDVTTLLLNRQIAAQKLLPSSGLLVPPAPKGEAFFLVEWNWWCHWCRHVDFFYTNELKGKKSSDKTMIMERVAMVLKMLPPGAVLPPLAASKSHKKKGTTSSVGTNSTTDSDDDDDDDDMDDSDDEDLLLGPPGVIDNSRLLFVPPLTTTKGAKQALEPYLEHWYDTSSLRPNLVRGHHYELLPREVYSALRSWYREVTPSVCRRTTERGVVTLYPSSTLNHSNNQNGTKTTVAQNSHLEQKCSACRAPHATARCKRCLSVRYCNRACQEGHWAFHKLACKALATAMAKGIDPAENLSHLDRFAGRVGLNQLGNTCFMNSALQCLSHATPLTRHFLSNQFKEDLNVSNPLGTGGKLANAYDIVMKDLWMKPSNNPNKATGIGGSMSPTALKRAIALFAPRFAGCLQHDAQEFLAYLLDGLHEDLNRIRRAPYVEMPDVTNGQNMAIAAAEAWDAHRRRNDSLIMDSFYGQFKSTCVCPKCDRVSVSFDTFNHVSLEIPQLHNIALDIPVLLFRNPSRNGNPSNGSSSSVATPLPSPKLPVRYSVSVRRNSLVEDLRRGLAELAGIPLSCLILCDVYDNAIYELLNDKKPISTVTSDLLTAYEVDPYTNTTIHVVATHSATMSLLDPASKVIDAKQTQQRRLFGYPFMTSFRANLTCRQVWDHIWNLVDYMVVEEGANHGFLDRNGEFRREDVVKIQIVDTNGKPRAVFGDKSDTEPDEGKDASVDIALSFIPPSSDTMILDYLGQESTESFLFLSLHWSNPRTKLSDDEPLELEKAPEEKLPTFLIQPKSFGSFRDHPSQVEAVRRRRAKNGGRGVSLDQCFETFTKPERLDENNMWYCSRCKEHVRALKTMKLWRLPNILIVHLKRFEFKHAFRRDKLDTFVDFPLEGLDMNSHCADWTATDNTNNSFVDGTVPADYDLFGVINHYGRMGFGHYTAYARKWDETGISNEWALFDDSNVKGVGDGTGDGGVVTSAAYVLFYRRTTFH